MAKPSKDRDRRAVVEQMRRDQRRKERRRTIAVIVACAVVALVIVGVAAVPLLLNRPPSGALTELGASTGSAGCQSVEKKKASGNQEHRPVGTKITYAEAPPAFGPHWPTPAAFARKFYTSADRPALEYVVHNLEHGYTLLWYDETVAKNKKQVAVIKAIAAKYQGQKLSDKFIALPWTSKDGKPFPGGKHIALTHWSAGGDPSDVKKQVGVWQYCSRPSGQATKTFTKDYPYTDSPEPQGA
jgi:hypothetical protein